jgi:hypothetical protein
LSLFKRFAIRRSVRQVEASPINHENRFKEYGQII